MTLSGTRERPLGAAFAATTLLSGAGLLAYLVLWAIVPRTDDAPKATGPVPAAA